MAEKARLAVLISGVSTNMAALVYASRIADCPYEVVLVASNDPAAQGLALAQAEGIATFSHPHKGLTREAHDAAMEAAVLESGAGYIVLAGYMRILSDSFVERWAGRMLNIHPSLLPDFKGLHPQRQALEAGVSEAGCTVHWVEPALDDGPAILQRRVPVLPGDTEETLSARILAEEHKAYPEALRLVATGAVRYGS